MTNPCLLDTDILSEVLKGRNQNVARHADAYLKSHGGFAISAFTRFEVVRGFRWRQATVKLAAFERLCQAMTIYPVADDILDRAADLWADGAAQGKPKWMPTLSSRQPPLSTDANWSLATSPTSLGSMA